MSEPLEFQLLDVLLIRSRSRRRMDIAGQIGLRATYRVQDINYGQDSPDVSVETAYRVTLEVDSGTEDDAGEEVAFVSSRMAVRYRADRPVSESDVMAGLLTPLSERATADSHPYHRVTLQRLVAELGFPRLPFPVEFSTSNEQMEANAAAQIALSRPEASRS